jgi:hypothetical protein
MSTTKYDLWVDTFSVRHLCRHEKFRELQKENLKFGNLVIKSTLFCLNIKVDTTRTFKVDMILFEY